MTSSGMTAYRRYLTTLFHIKTWYEFDFQPGSRTLVSLDFVKRKHNAASKLSFKKLNYRFKQREMALAMFGLVGFPLVRGKMVGIHNPKEEDLRAFLHVSRILGYALGIEDRFNICRDSVQETREICNILLQRYFTPLAAKPDKQFVEMMNYMFDGLSAVDPTMMDYHLCMTYLRMVLENQNDYTKIKNPNFKDISWFVKMKLNMTSAMMCCLKYEGFRLFAQYMTLFKLWMAKVFPVLAYIKFGIKNGHVDFF